MRERDEADNSGTTAQFRAFVDSGSGAEVAQPWSMRAPRNRVAILAASVVGAAIVLALIALMVIR
jgi:uncharacterized membrane protein YeaQ/YmgE (transglycosylase-associated protein family)